MLYQYRKYRNKETGKLIRARFDYPKDTYHVVETGEKLTTAQFAGKYKVAFVK